MRVLGVIERHGDRRGRAEQRQDLQEPGKIVDDEAAAETRQLSGRQQQENDAGNGQQRNGGIVDHAPGPASLENAQHQQRGGADAENDFRQHRNKPGEVVGVHRFPWCSFGVTSSTPPFARR